jgi:hypothetical protein
MKKITKVITAGLFAVSVSPVWAQISKAKTALNSVSTDLQGIFDTVTKIMYAVAAIAGLIGAITIYQKWNSGDPNTNKLVGAWFGAALFLAVVATFLKAMFVS